MIEYSSVQFFSPRLSFPPFISLLSFLPAPPPPFPLFQHTGQDSYVRRLLYHSLSAHLAHFPLTHLSKASKYYTGVRALLASASHTILPGYNSRVALFLLLSVVLYLSQHHTFRSQPRRAAPQLHDLTSHTPAMTIRESPAKSKAP